MIAKQKIFTKLKENFAESVSFQTTKNPQTQHFQSCLKVITIKFVIVSLVRYQFTFVQPKLFSSASKLSMVSSTLQFLQYL